MESQYSTNESEKKIENSFPHVIANILDSIVLESETNHLDENLQENLVFNAKKPPLIKLEKYIQRIISATKCEEDTIIHSLFLIDSLCEINDIFLTKRNLHRILISAVVIAIKYSEDVYYSNDFYAKVGGISLQELNKLELEFFQMIHYKVYAEESVFLKYKLSIQEQMLESSELKAIISDEK
jgi:hypothetical protein